MSEQMENSKNLLDKIGQDNFNLFKNSKLSIDDWLKNN